MATRLTDEVKAKLGLLVGDLSDTSEWNGAQGNQVEYYIKEQFDKIDKNVVADADFDPNSKDLIFKNINGDLIGDPINITLVPATYDAYLLVLELKVVDENNRVTYHSTGSEILFSENKTYYLGVALAYTATTTNTLNRNGNYRPTITFGSLSKTAATPIRNIDYKLFDAENRQLLGTLTDDEKRQLITNANAWVDVTSILRNNATTANFSVSYIDSSLTDEAVDNSFALTNRIITITYNGATVNTTGIADFIVTGVSSDYLLYYSYYDTTTNRATAITASSALNITNNNAHLTLPYLGLNKLKIYACKGIQSTTTSANGAAFDILSDPLFVDIINASNNWSGTAIALGTLPTVIDNNNIALLFEVTAYSGTNTPQEITIYLDDNEDDPSNVIKSEIITADLYDVTTHIYKTTVSKYIEVNSTNASKNIFVYVNGEPYGFLIRGNNTSSANIFKTVTLEEVIPEFIYTPGYTKSFDLITGAINNVFVTSDYASLAGQSANVLLVNTATDGWVEENGRTVFRVTPSAESIFTTAPAILGTTIPDSGCTIEFAFKTDNVVDYQLPILKFGNWELWANKLIFNDGALDMTLTLSDFVKRLTPFNVGQATHIVITIHPNYQIKSTDPDYPSYINAISDAESKYNDTSFNLMRIYVNGTIARSIELTTSDLTSLAIATLDITNQASDIDFYLFRTYNSKALTFEEVRANYLSYIPYKTSADNSSLNKTDYYNKNDVLENGQVSYKKCLNKYNTIVYIYPTGAVPPNYAQLDSRDDVAIVVNYANPSTNLKYGGRLNHLENKGQGTSAKRYLVWNQQTKITDDTTFVSNEYLNADGTLYNTVADYLDVTTVLASHTVRLAGVDMGEATVIDAGTEDELTIYTFGEISVESPQLYDIYLLRESVFIYSDLGWVALGGIPAKQIESVPEINSQLYLNVIWSWNESVTKTVDGEEVTVTEKKTTANMEEVDADAAPLIGLSLNQIATDTPEYFDTKDTRLPLGETVTFTTQKSLSKDFPDYYLMPGEDNIKVTKLVGKVNFASSMQTHKQGICNMYDACYKSISDLSLKIPSNTRKTVHEEAFLYFWMTSDDPSNINPEDIVNPTFLGFQTWGSGKCDKGTIGYDKNKNPEYLVIEGGANADMIVNFKRPWISLQRGVNEEYNTTVNFTDNNAYPYVDTAESLNNPWKHLCIIDESISYLGDDSWGIDVGYKENPNAKKQYTVANKLKSSDYNSLKHFRAFHDFVYQYHNEYVITSEKTPSSTWDKTKLYVVTSSTFSLDGSTNYTSHSIQDVYRAHEIESQGKTYTWVPAGVGYTKGTGFTALNLKQLVSAYGYDSDGGAENNILNITQIFKEHIKDYIDVDDFAFHQAFIRFISGTDNRAKNTYFLIVGPEYVLNSEGGYDKPEESKSVTLGAIPDYYKIKLFLDDVDTAFITDNAGAFTKTYDIVEPSYSDKFVSDWGDGGLNTFFNMFDVLFESEIRDRLKEILEWAKISYNGTAETNTPFYIYYYSIIDQLPAICYNITSKLWYENAHVFKAGGVIKNYNNNDTAPLTQSHGSAYEAECQFLSQRIPFLASYARVSSGTVLGPEGSLTVSNASSNVIKVTTKLSPVLTLYPIIDLSGGALDISVGYIETKPTTSKLSDVEYYKLETNTTKDLVLEGLAMNGRWPLSYLYKTIEASGFLVTDFTNYPFNSATSLKITDTIISDFRPIAPALLYLTLSEVRYQSTNALDLSSYTKIKQLDISKCTGISEVVFPNSSMLTTMALPSTLTTFRIYNNPNLKNVTFTPANLQTLYIEGSKCGGLDVSTLMSHSTLTNVLVVNADITITKAALNYLIEIGFIFSGTITISDNLDMGSLGNILKFWDITSQTLNGNNIVLEGTSKTDSDYSVKIIYKSIAIKRESTIELNYWGTTYPITEKIVPQLSGNNVRIIQGAINYTYSTPSVISGVPSSEATWTLINGELWIREVPSIETKIAVTVTIPTLAGDVSQVYNLNLTYIAPKLGDYVFTDGSYGRIKGSKTYVGFIYKVDSAKSEIYVINNTSNAIESLPLGPIALTGDVSEDSSSYSGNALAIIKFSNWMRSLGLGLDQTVGFSLTGTTNSVSSTRPSGSIYLKLNYEYSGPKDTKLYVGMANQVLTHLVRNHQFDTTYLETTGDSNPIYYIPQTGNDGLTNLRGVITQLLNFTKTQNDESSFRAFKPSIIFPYFYARYLYKLDNSVFNRWYAPSVGEWTDIIYYRVQSGADSAPVNDPNAIISSSIYNNENNTNAIFPQDNVYAGMFSSSITAQNPTTTAANHNNNHAPYSYLYDYFSGDNNTWGYGSPMFTTSTSNGNYHNGSGVNWWGLNTWRDMMTVLPYTGFLFTKMKYSNTGLINSSYDGID